MVRERTRGQVNILDIVFGASAFLILPLLTLVFLKSAQAPVETTPEGAPVVRNLPISPEEFIEEKDEIVRVFKKQCALFMTRSRGEDLTPEERQEELGWASLVLLRCRDGLRDIERRTRDFALLPQFVDHFKELQQWIREVESQLAQIPPDVVLRAQTPAVAPPPPRPPAPTAGATPAANPASAPPPAGAAGTGASGASGG